MTAGRGERIGVLMINFGEPTDLSLPAIVPFLERIFLRNAGLEERGDAGRARARELAEARAPALLEEYLEIGGSPLNHQAAQHARALHASLSASGIDAAVAQGFQFTRPFILDALAELREAGVEHLVALPIYPLCGYSTTVAALDDVREGLAALGWGVEWTAISGWHHHPDYIELRARAIRRYCHAHDLDPTDDDTLLYFSAHGTPVKYLVEGSRYDRYVHEHCAAVADAVGTDRWTVGFQNHTNRRIAWTRPDNEDRIAELSERHLVVDAISFMHEQSETLSELDDELKAFTEGLGKHFHRVPVPHDDPAFPEFLRTVVDAALDRPGTEGSFLSPCRCRSARGTFCTNGARDLPASPWGGDAFRVADGQAGDGRAG
ncbi:MAG: ferrochelatase [Longimicrobiales bacterium]|nr:ferrochelatase [Longimicrobiales bacterium]